MSKERDTLQAVIDLAPKLRAAGVLWIETEGLTLKLAPAAPDPGAVDSDPVEEESSNPWNDPVSFGRVKGVPGKDPKRKG